MDVGFYICEAAGCLTATVVQGKVQVQVANRPFTVIRTSEQVAQVAPKEQSARFLGLGADLGVNDDIMMIIFTSLILLLLKIYILVSNTTHHQSLHAGN